MPQLDFTQYSSQIFWLVLCFITLYYFVSKHILPRVNEIIEKRKNLIEKEENKSFQLQQKVNEFQKQSQEIRQISSSNYRDNIENSQKEAIKIRQEALENLKTKIDNLTFNSQKKIIDFITHGESRRTEVINEFIKSIKTKIFN